MSYDRTTEDIGNIVEFGHVNTRIPDQRLATLFYVTGLGLTRDPYLVTGVDNMWVNAGVTQMHLPTGPTQCLCGTTVLAMPDLAHLAWRLSRVLPMLTDTQFAFAETEDGVEVTSPWGNRFRCVADAATRLGIIAVEIDVAPGTSDGIARFYREVLGTTATFHAGVAHVPAGLSTMLMFRETDRNLPAFDGTHIQISLADFSRPHARLAKAGLITEESNQSQYRFESIIDPQNGAVLCTLEHEVRSMRHPTYGRPLVNRDPTVTNNRFAPGREALVLGNEPGEFA
jgi:hypothetical protein